MTIYTCNRKRMVINKFSNRPPFELKTNETSVLSSISEKHKKSLESITKSYNSIIKQLDNIDSAIDKKQSAKIKTHKNIAPKIIESFQRITPKREVIMVKNRNYLSSEDSSVQTIFRNKSSNFGKHIPNHKIMKNLLKNFGSGTKMYIENDQVDTIPTRDTDRGAGNCAKVDKTTSTSGIAWPVVLPSPQICDCNSTQKIRNNHSEIPHYCLNKTFDKTKSKIPKRKNATSLQKKVEKEDNTRITSTASNFDLNASKKSPERVAHYVPTREHTYIIDEENAGTENEKRGLIKENSFVLRQVEKFNKIGKNKQGRKKTAKTAEFQKRNWILNKNYLGMMSSARTGFPKIEEKLLEDTTTGYEWSDSDNTKPEVKFPKETRHAMETIIRNATRPDRTPLAKYLRHQDLDLQPAIPVYQDSRRGPPYAKNALPDRGDHDYVGKCANMEKVSPCRCSDRPIKKHRSRRIPIKCKQ